MCTSKILTDLCFIKQRIKPRYLFKSFLQCFSSKNVLREHKEVYSSINDAQSVRFEKGINELKNYFKQIPVPFKIHADSERNLESVES